MTFHLHTENRSNLPSIVANYFDGATITTGIGLWKGSSEPTAVIEILTNDPDQVRHLARAIQNANAQESVLIESLSSTSALCCEVNS